MKVRLLASSTVAMGAPEWHSPVEVNLTQSRSVAVDHGTLLVEGYQDPYPIAHSPLNLGTHRSLKKARFPKQSLFPWYRPVLYSTRIVGYFQVEASPQQMLAFSFCILTLEGLFCKSSPEKLIAQIFDPLHLASFQTLSSAQWSLLLSLLPLVAVYTYNMPCLWAVMPLHRGWCPGDWTYDLLQGLQHL